MTYQIWLYFTQKSSKTNFKTVNFGIIALLCDDIKRVFEFKPTSKDNMTTIRAATSLERLERMFILPIPSG